MLVGVHGLGLKLLLRACQGLKIAIKHAVGLAPDRQDRIGVLGLVQLLQQHESSFGVIELQCKISSFQTGFRSWGQSQ